ncbi:MAG: alanine--tRNA ligase [Candidatus Omnitrophica bacterium]|nr:alanine--tRNA ligase [Candidatus Omnitrophota bacterium]
MKTDQIRSAFLEFFAQRGHTIVPSDSLVPQNDPTLLFTGAGMNQFKEYFLGLKKDMKRAASSQKCLRTADLDEVGRTAYHHTFFEMLGNFSFGDYFKQEAIQWAWELLTKGLHISPERLRVSVHENDEEALKIWREKIKVREDWIYRLGDKTNFWPSNAPKDGPNGPCGPCSEIYYDQDPQSRVENLESERFAEIWNLVFTQFDRQDGGKLIQLKNKNIDTGMGLKRLACVLQGVRTNYEIDIFQTLNQAVAYALGIEQNKENQRRIYAISDHARAVIFAMADGVIPGNEGRGYVIRKIIRRALWHAHQIVPKKKLHAAFLYRLIPDLVHVMGQTYPVIIEAEASIAVTLRGEEERFLATLETGLKILEKKLSELLKNKSTCLSGENVFELYDTYGFPDELTRTIAGARGFSIDQESFNALMEKQRQRAKESSPLSQSIFVSSNFEKKLSEIPETKFLGYQTLSSQGRVLLADIHQKKGIIVLDQTPLYGESGGQVGDQGFLENEIFYARVTDTQRKGGHTLHAVEVVTGTIRTSDEVKATVDLKRRERIMRNHTATHLLHASLRKFLGPQVRQMGSLVSPEKLRFDYSYPDALTPGVLQKIEDDVNDQILKNSAVVIEEKTYQEAKKEGALAFFGEKYGSHVRIVSVPGHSKECCGGTHCDYTGQIGLFLIESDFSIGSGTRRIEAVTGDGAILYARSLRDMVARMAQTLKTSPRDLEARIIKLQDICRKLEKGQSGGLMVTADVEQVLSERQPLIGDLGLIIHSQKDLGIEALRRLSDILKSKAQKTIYLVGSETDDKIQFVMGMSQDLQTTKIDLRNLMVKLSPFLGTSGGGRKDMVQGGGPNRGQLHDVRDKIKQEITAYLKETGI